MTRNATPVRSRFAALVVEHAFDGVSDCPMAGGMSRKGDRRTLAERIHGDQPPASPVKPCWVTDRHGRHPGLLLEWRHVASGWHGRVVRPVLDASGWVVVEEWLPAELLEGG